MDCGVEAGLRLAEMGVNCICMLATCLLSFSKELPRRDHQKPAVSARGAADRSARLLHILSALVFPQRRLLLPSFLPSLALPLSACPLNPMRSLSLSLICPLPGAGGDADAHHCHHARHSHGRPLLPPPQTDWPASRPIEPGAVRRGTEARQCDGDSGQFVLCWCCFTLCCRR